MIRSVLKIGLILVAGILIYNFFYGTDEEREQSKRIVGEFKEVGVAVKDLLKSEKEKLDEGKYDDALAKMKNLFEKVGDGIEKLDPNAVSTLNDLERKRRNLEEEVERKNQGDLTDAEKEELNTEMEELLRETEQLLKDIQNQ